MKKLEKLPFDSNSCNYPCHIPSFTFHGLSLVVFVLIIMHPGGGNGIKFIYNFGPFLIQNNASYCVRVCTYTFPFLMTNKQTRDSPTARPITDLPCLPALPSTSADGESHPIPSRPVSRSPFTDEICIRAQECKLPPLTHVALIKLYTRLRT